MGYQENGWVRCHNAQNGQKLEVGQKQGQRRDGQMSWTEDKLVNMMI
jgi:hypothetical protein